MKMERPQSKQPLPEKATKVFKGELFDVYQWEQEMYDGTIATFEKVKRPDTVIVFGIFDDGKILLTKQEQPGMKPFISAAGGRVDEGEDILKAAKRELLEETGYEASEYVLWKAMQPISKVEWCVYVFIAKNLRTTSNLSLDAGEKIEVIAVDFDEFIKMVLQENFDGQEIYKDIAETMFDEEKKNKLKELFSTK